MKNFDLVAPMATVLKTPNAEDIRGFKVSNSCTKFAVYYSSTILYYDSRTGNDDVKILSGHTSDVTCLIFTGDSKRIISGSADGTIKLWDADGSENTCLDLTGHTNKITCIAEYDWLLVSGSDDSTIRVWYLDNRKPNTSITTDSPVYRLALLESRIVAGVMKDKLQLWHINSTLETYKVLNQKDITAIAFSALSNDFQVAFGVLDSEDL